MRSVIVIKRNSGNFETKILAYLLFFIFISYYINVSIQMGLNISVSVSAMFYGVAVCLGVLSYFIGFIRKSALSLLSVIIFTLGTGLFFILHPSFIGAVYTNFLDLAYNPSIICLFYCVPVLILCLCGRIDYELLQKRMACYSYIILILYIIDFFVFRVSTTGLGTTYMTFSYYALPSICVCLVNHTDARAKDIFSRFLSIMGIIITIIGGSRGALVCNIAFICLVVFFSESISLRRKIISIVVMVLGTILVYFNFAIFIQSISKLLINENISSRTISMFLDSSFIHSQDRNDLWVSAIEATKKSPFLGYGMWGDRSIVTKGYAHNIFVELWCSYGFVFGTIISFALIAIIAWCLFKGKSIDNNLHRLFMIAIPMGFVHLLFSGSYLTDIWFFFLIGLAYNMKKAHRKNTFSNNHFFEPKESRRMVEVN